MYLVPSMDINVIEFSSLEDIQNSLEDILNSLEDIPSSLEDIHNSPSIGVRVTELSEAEVSSNVSLENELIVTAPGGMEVSVTELSVLDGIDVNDNGKLSYEVWSI